MVLEGTVNKIIKNCLFHFKYIFCITFVNHAHCQCVVCVGLECDMFCRKHAVGVLRKKIGQGCADSFPIALPYL